MLYIYDILVNFIDGDRVYEFFEWEKDDVVLHIKKIPLIKVEDKIFYNLIYNSIIVDRDLLELIKNKTYSYNNKIEYACCFTNGNKCYVIEFNEEGKIISRSSLLIDEEDDIILCSKKLINVDFTYKIVKENEFISYKNTRFEERKIKRIKEDLSIALKNNNTAKINYLYNEIYKDKEIDIEKKYNKIINNLNKESIKKLYSIICLEHKKKKAI